MRSTDVCFSVPRVVVLEYHNIYFPPKQNKNKKILFSQSLLFYFHSPLCGDLKSERIKAIILYLAANRFLNHLLYHKLRKGMLENKHKLLAGGIHNEWRL